MKANLSNCLKRLGVRWQSAAATPLLAGDAFPPKRRGASLPAAVQNLAALFVCLLALGINNSSAATNDLSGLLQKGLFEEEANRDLEAASTAYETLVKQFDKDRQIGATAIFRLGEVYRKQGKTNEAVLLYERIIRDFAEQTTLVTLSRQNLNGLGSAASESERVLALTNSNISLEGLRAQHAFLQAQIAQLRDESNTYVVAKAFDDRQLAEALDRLSELTKALKQRKVNSPEFSDLEQKIRAEEDWMLICRKRLFDFQEKRLAILEAVLQNMSGLGASTDNNKKALAPPDVDDAEIRRLQTLIQNSPDLINGGTGGSSPLFRAVENGQARVVSFLLDHQADVNRPSGGRTPLHRAVQLGNQAIVEQLLERGADVNARDGTGGTALHEAAQAGFLSIVELLLNHKADLDARNSKSNGEQSALHLAAKNGHVAVVSFLLNHGDNANRKDASGDTPLHEAVQAGQDGVVGTLLKAGADVDALNNGGDSALITAAAWGRLNAAKSLLAAKAKVDAVNGSGRTALSYAAEGGYREIAGELLAAKANPNIGKSNLPLLIAVQGKNLEIARMLLEAGAKANRAGSLTWKRFGSGAYTTYGNDVTPLAVAMDSSEGKPVADMVKLLLEYKADPDGDSVRGGKLLLAALSDFELTKAFLDAGADPNRKLPGGSTFLIEASVKGNAEILEALLAHGAEVNARGEKGKTALMTAVLNTKVEAMGVLLEHKADVNLADSFGGTALRFAVSGGKKEFVELLLKHGAEPNVRGGDGQTPLDLAKEAAKRASAAPNTSSAAAHELVALLRKYGALDDLPDFNSIRVTRHGVNRPYPVFLGSEKLTNQFTLLETVLRFYAQPSIFSETRKTTGPAYEVLPFPDYGRIVIRRPSSKPNGKEQEIKVSLLNGKQAVDCSLDVPLQFGDVVEIPERVHALDERVTNPALEMKWALIKTKEGDAVRVGFGTRIGMNADDRIAYDHATTNGVYLCLVKGIELIVGGSRKTLEVESWTEGFLVQALAKTEARAVLRSSSDLTRVKVTRKDAKSKKPVVYTVDATDANDSLWLQDGDVIEVPDKSE